MSGDTETEQRATAVQSGSATQAVSVEGLVDFAIADPPSALHEATLLLNSQPTSVRDEALIRRGLGVAHRLLGQLDESQRELDTALALAATPGAKDVWPLCALSLAATKIYQGHLEVGLDLCRQATQSATGVDRAEAWFQLGSAQLQAGDLSGAVESYKIALPAIRRYGRRDWEALLLANRSIVAYYQRRYVEAQRDMEAAIVLFEEQGDELGVAQTKQSLGITLHRLGDIPQALALLDSIHDFLVDFGVPEATLLKDRCEVLLAAGFFDEALQAALKASASFRDTGDTPRRLDALASAINAALALEQFDLVEKIADDAAELVGANEFPGFLARCQHGALQARTRSGQAVAGDFAEAVKLRQQLLDSGLREFAQDASVQAADCAVAAGLLDEARPVVDYNAGRVRRSPLHLQVHHWDTVARIRAADDNTTGAIRAVQAGMRAWTNLQFTAGSFEMRVQAGRHADSLLRTATDVLVAKDRPNQLRRLVETVRSNAVRWTSGTAGSPHLRRALQELRTAQVVDEDGSGRGPVAELQRKVVELSRVQARKAPALAEELPVRDGEVEFTFVPLRGQMHATVRTCTSEVLIALGEVAAIQDTNEAQSYVERQLARRSRLSEKMVGHLVAEHDRLGDELQNLLLPPTALWADAERVILNPPAELQSLSWASLPALRGLAHCVSPSLAIARRPLPAQLDKVTVVGSTELAFAQAEATAVASLHGAAVRLDPSADVLASLDRADLFHAVAHFVRQGHNPLFDAVQFPGFDLHGYELFMLKGAPLVSVLSACSSAGSTAVGQASTGFATALLATGGSCVIATQSTVEDGAAIAQVMESVHRHLAAGVAPADALRETRRNLDAADVPLGAQIVTLGSGW